MRALPWGRFIDALFFLWYNAGNKQIAEPHAADDTSAAVEEGIEDMIPTRDELVQFHEHKDDYIEEVAHDHSVVNVLAGFVESELRRAALCAQGYEGEQSPAKVMIADNGTGMPTIFLNEYGRGIHVLGLDDVADAFERRGLSALSNKEKCAAIVLSMEDIMERVRQKGYDVETSREGEIGPRKTIIVRNWIISWQ